MIDAPPHTNGHHHKRDETASPVSGFALLKNLPMRFLGDQEIGDRDGGKVGFPYFDNDGSRLFERTRNPADYDCRFSHPKGVRVRPYGLWHLPDWDVGILAITEGESDALTLWLHDVPALGLPGADTIGCLTLEDLAGVEELLVCPDNDESGKRMLDSLANHLGRIGYRGRVRVVRLPGKVKDLSDLFVSDPKGFPTTWKRLTSEAELVLVPRAEAAESGNAPGATGAKGENQQHRARGFRVNALDSAEFFSKQYRLDYLVDGLLVADQPAVLGGPRKALKTSLVVDLAVSLCVAVPFLGRFRVRHPRRVLLLSGESGEAVLQETAVRVCRAKVVATASLNGRLFWHFDLPQLGSSSDLAGLSEGIRDLRAEVVIDPLYLCLTSGVGRPVDHANLFDVGPILRGAARACIEAGATPVLIHHARKNKGQGDPHLPLELDDLSFAGIQEFARQWLLLNRRERYSPDQPHRLWLSAGGSAGHGGLWGLDVNDRRPEAGSPRSWDVQVMTVDEVRDGVAVAKEEADQKRKARQAKANSTRLLTALDELAAQSCDGFVGTNALRNSTGLNNDSLNQCIDDLVSEGVVERGSVMAATGIGGKSQRKAAAVRRRLSGLSGQNDHSSGQSDSQSVRTDGPLYRGPSCPDTQSGPLPLLGERRSPDSPSGQSDDDGDAAADCGGIA